MLNCDWLLSGEAVDAAEAGEAGDASLKCSSRIWVDDDDAPSSSCGVSFCREACGVLLGEGDSLCHYFLEGWEPDQGSS